MDLKTISIITAVLGIFIFIFNYFYVTYEFLYLIAVILILIGPSTMQYLKFRENKEIEDNFPEFLRDISENVKSGMSLTKAIRETKNNDYGALSKYIKKLVIRIDWGSSLEEALEDFSKEKNQSVRRTVYSILEIYRGGGNIKKVFEAIANSVTEMNKIRKERQSTIYSQLLTGYVVYFVFLGVLVSLQKFLLPTLLAQGTTDISFFASLFQQLIIIQGFFSGLVIGKMSEGKLIAGLKHCLILILVGYSVLIFVL